MVDYLTFVFSFQIFKMKFGQTSKQSNKKHFGAGLEFALKSLRCAFPNQNNHFSRLESPNAKLSENLVFKKNWHVFTT